MAMCKPLLLALLALACCSSASAHGGGLHKKYSWWSASYPPRFTHATVSQFSVYDPTRSAAYEPGPVNWYPATQKPYKVSGTVEVVQYLDPACGESTTLIPTLTFKTAANKPLASTKIYAYGFVGSCKTGVIDLYKGDNSLGTNGFNLMWWKNATTSAAGAITGIAPNDFILRRPPAPTALRSLLLVAQGYPLMCGDLVYKPADPKWSAKVKACKPNPALGE